MKGKKIAGRQKGTPNKVTANVRDKFQLLLDGYSTEDMMKDLLSLQPAERLKIVSGLADFIVPRLARQTTISEGDMVIRVVRE